jgi:eukaryotic-like serine/threonine-protein kinase
MPEETTTPPAESQAPLATTPSPVKLPTDFVAPEQLAEVPGYTIIRELGRGGMGVVYLAQQIGLDRLVALKVVLFAEHSSSELRRRFVSEARTVARLSHPNIVQIYDIAEHKGLPYFSLEYCAGGTLSDRLGKGPLPPREAADIVRTLAIAVHAAHERGIVHRDLKPDNVLLTAAGELKVADFGLAKRLGAAGLTETGAVLGTPSYMAPEQAAGKKDIGMATDVHALGAILYRLLTGHPPFEGPTTLDILHRVMESEPKALSEMNPKVPRDLETIALKCLQKQPIMRYRSAAELADELRRYRAGEAIWARPQSWVEKAWRWSKKHPGLTILRSMLPLLVGISYLAVGIIYVMSRRGPFNTVNDGLLIGMPLGFLYLTGFFRATTKAITWGYFASSFFTIIGLVAITQAGSNYDKALFQFRPPASSRFFDSSR